MLWMQPIGCLAGVMPYTSQLVGTRNWSSGDTWVSIVGHEEFAVVYLVVTSEHQRWHIRVEFNFSPLDVDGRLHSTAAMGVFFRPVHLIQVTFYAPRGEDKRKRESNTEGKPTIIKKYFLKSALINLNTLNTKGRGQRKQMQGSVFDWIPFYSTFMQPLHYFNTQR